MQQLQFTQLPPTMIFRCHYHKSRDGSWCVGVKMAVPWKPNIWEKKSIVSLLWNDMQKFCFFVRLVIYMPTFTYSMCCWFLHLKIARSQIKMFDVSLIPTTICRFEKRMLGLQIINFKNTLVKRTYSTDICKDLCLETDVW